MDLGISAFGGGTKAKPLVLGDHAGPTRRSADGSIIVRTNLRSKHVPWVDPARTRDIIIEGTIRGREPIDSVNSEDDRKNFTPCSAKDPEEKVDSIFLCALRVSVVQIRVSGESS